MSNETPSVPSSSPNGDGSPVQTMVGAFDPDLDSIVESFKQQVGVKSDDESESEEKSDNSEGEESSEEQVDEGEASEDEEVEEAADESEEKVKKETKSEEKKDGVPQKVTISHKGQKIELEDDATLKVRVDGKVQEVSIADLKKDFAGKVAYENKYRELSEERQVMHAERLEFESEKDEWTEKLVTVDNELNEIFELAKKDGLRAYVKLCTMAGLKTKDQIIKYIEQAQGVIGKLSKMTPEGRMALLDRIDLEQEREKLERANKLNSKKEETTKFQTELKTMLGKAGVEMSEYLGAWKTLEKRPEVFKGLDENGIAKKVLDFVMVDRVYNRAEAGIRKVNPKLLSQEGFVEKIVNLTAPHQDLTPDDIVDIVRGIVGGSSKPTKKVDPKTVSHKEPKSGAPTKKDRSVELSSIDKLISSVMESELP